MFINRRERDDGCASSLKRNHCGTQTLFFFSTHLWPPPFSLFSICRKRKKKVSLYILSMCVCRVKNVVFSYFSALKVNNKQTAINKIVAVSTPRRLTPRFHFIFSQCAFTPPDARETFKCRPMFG